MKPCFLLLDQANAITFNGSSYRCYTLPQYDSPFVEVETITMFIRDPLVSGTLMTGQQDGYQFSLYIIDQKVYYEASLDDVGFASVSTTSNFERGTLQVNRNGNTVMINRIDDNSQMMILATGSITEQEFGSVRFTDICVGGDLILYSSILQSVYYNLHYLSASGAVFDERIISTVTNRVNFADPNAHIVLPGNLQDNTNIQLLFRTSQKDAILLQSQDSNSHFRISIDNSQLFASLNASGTTLNRRCSLVNITGATWYRLTVEPVVEACDAACEMLIALSYAADSTGRIIDRCDLDSSAVASFSSIHVVVGGEAGGVEGLMGCLELMVNNEPLNLEGVINGDTIRNDDDCGSCDIMPPPCLNGGTCVPQSDYNFTCSCVSPYFGDTCGECCYYT